MKRASRFIIIIFLLIVSCGRQNNTGSRMISVSIAPFKYFVEAIAGDRFSVNIMVPSGANPHIYEPYPDQINKLRQSVAYISNGFLGFEMTWLDRFYEMNRNMKKLSLGNYIDAIASQDNHHYENAESADPHYWVSPKCAFRMASSVRDFLAELDPGNRSLYDENLKILNMKIMKLDSMANELALTTGKKTFMIYHPNLAYLSRDYGLREIAVEGQGKEPSPSRLKELIDLAKTGNLKVILVQREYDTRNARAIADETGSRVVVIDPLSEDWYTSTAEIIRILKESFLESLK